MFKKLAIAVSAALVSTSAMAIAPSATIPNFEIFMSGATAQDIGIANVITDMCVPGTLDTFTQSSNHAAYYCNVNVALVTGDANGAFAGLPAWTAANPGVNPTVLFHKRSAGGSALGVSPIYENTPITHMNIWNTVRVPNASNCTVTAPGSRSWTCTTTNLGDTLETRSDLGVSDVNPEMFVGANVPSGFNPIIGTTPGITIKPAAALVFGIPVTLKLRNALQQIQFGSLSPLVGLDTEAAMPTLSRAQVASLMSGGIRSWSQVLDDNGLPLNTHPSVTDLPTSSLVNICRRVNGSGTQAQMSAKFLNYPCTPGAKAPLQAPGNTFLGPVVTEGSGSGNVDTCLTTANTNDRWAIGIQSTEKNVNLALAYRFIKIDGVAPTINNAADGKYMDWVEQSYQWRDDNFLSKLDMLNIVQTIVANAAKPSIVRDSNLAFAHTWGQGGYLALKSLGFASDNVFNIANPVTPYTHTFGGGTDNCRSPVVVSGNMSL